MNDQRYLFQIANEIKLRWTKVNYGALPWLNAMSDLQTIQDKYGFDSGDMIVRYFLANASTWRGEDARRIKKELNQMLKK